MAQPSLLVAAEQKTAMPLALQFRNSGWNVHFAGDAMTVMGAALRCRPDVVLLSVELAGGGGLTVLKRLRASIHTALTPVVAMGCRSPRERQDLVAAGAQDCVDIGANDEVVATVRRQVEVAPPPPPATAPLATLNQPERLAALHSARLLDTAPDPSFDQLTRLAAKLLGAPTALLSIVDKDRQFFKSQVGLGEPWASARQTPLTHSFCQWVVSGQEPVVVSDARQHPVLQANLAVRDLGVSAYAGVPLTDPFGASLGSFCAIDGQPRPWSELDLKVLDALSGIARGLIAEQLVDHDGVSISSETWQFATAYAQSISGAAWMLQRDDLALTPVDRRDLLAHIQRFAQRLEGLGRPT